MFLDMLDTFLKRCKRYRLRNLNTTALHNASTKLTITLQPVSQNRPSQNREPLTTYIISENTIARDVEYKNITSNIRIHQKVLKVAHFLDDVITDAFSIWRPNPSPYRITLVLQSDGEAYSVGCFRHKIKTWFYNSHVASSS